MLLYTGISRSVDGLGKIGLPKSLRNNFDIQCGDALEIYVDDNVIIFRKYEPGCLFCGNVEHVQNFKGRNICAECAADITNQAISPLMPRTL